MVAENETSADTTDELSTEEQPLEKIAAELIAWMRGLAEGLRAVLDKSDARREAGRNA